MITRFFSVNLKFFIKMCVSEEILPLYIKNWLSIESQKHSVENLLFAFNKNSKIKGNINNTASARKLLKYAPKTIHPPEKIIVEYPVGHRNRREEGIPLLIKKFEDAISSYYSKNQSDDILSSFLDKEKFLNMTVNEMMDKLNLKKLYLN